MDDDEFFMAVAFLTAERSKDPITQVRHNNLQCIVPVVVLIRLVHV